MFESIKKFFRRKHIEYVLVRLAPVDDIDQSPLFEDFGFKILSKPFDEVVFRLRSLVSLPRNGFLMLTFDIAVEYVPIFSKHTAEELMDVNKELHYRFIEDVRTIIEHFVKTALDNESKELIDVRQAEKD